MYFVYKLSHPISGDVCYIGITDDLYHRFKDHINVRAKGGTKKDVWIFSLKEENLIPSISVIETVGNYGQAAERERYWIQHYLQAGAVLFNTVLVGGEALPPEFHYPARRYAAYHIKLREWRILKKMTVRDLASCSGCAMTTITRSEKGIPVARPSVVNALATALGITPEQLLDGPEMKTSQAS